MTILKLRSIKPVRDNPHDYFYLVGLQSFAITNLLQYYVTA